MLENSIAACVATIFPQFRVASKVNDSKINEVQDSNVKAQERFQEVQEQVQEVHNSKIKVQEQVQEVQEQVREGQQAQEVQEVQEGSAPGRDPHLPPARGVGRFDAAPLGRHVVLP